MFGVFACIVVWVGAAQGDWFGSIDLFTFFCPPALLTARDPV